MWYLAEIAGEAEKQGVAINEAIALLNEAKIPSAKIDVKRPRTISGISFPKEHRERALSMLGFAGQYFKEEATEKSELVFLAPDDPFMTFRPLPEEREFLAVNERDRGMERWDAIEPVLKRYAQLLHLDIYARNPHAELSEPKTEAGKLFIRFYSAAKVEFREDYKTVFGQALENCQANGVQASVQGFPFIDDSGQVIGEIIGSTFYIYFDLPHGDDRAETAVILELIMENFARLLKTDGLAEFQRTRLEAERRRSRELYIKECARRTAHTIDATQKAIRQTDQTVVSSMAAIVEATRSREGYVKKLAQITASADGDSGNYAQEYDRLIAMKGIEDVKGREGYIDVFTEHIYIHYERLIFDIGKFRIQIQTNGENGGVKCFNLTRQVGGYHHPHVQSRGECCLGNISGDVAQMIGTYEFGMAVSYMLQFLRSYNNGNPYHNIENWSKV